jgi:hypothetical protein
MDKAHVRNTRQTLTTYRQTEVARPNEKGYMTVELQVPSVWRNITGRTALHRSTAAFGKVDIQK